MRHQLEENLVLSGPKFIEHREYWLSKLVYEDVTELLSPNPALYVKEQYEEVACNIQGDLFSKIMKTGNQSNLSVFIILLSAVKILIKKYSGKSRNAVLTPVNLNSDLSLNDFVIIQDEMDDGISYRDFLIRVGRSVLDGYKNQDFPMEKILDRMGIEDNQDRMSRVICKMNEIHNVRPIQMQRDISFEFEVHASDISVVIKYCAGLFDAFYVREALGHFIKILETVFQDIQQPIGAIQILSSLEQQELMANPLSMPLPQGVFTTLFEEQADRVPGAIAVTCGTVQWDYNTLNARSNQLARYMRKKVSMHADDLVALIMDRSALMVQCILATWKCGAAYLPIDPAWPAERIELVIEMAKPKLIFVDDTVTEIQNKYAGKIITANELAQECVQQETDNLNMQINPDQLAYVIFTSGSTGSPKGVMIEHKGMLNHLFAKINEFGIKNESVIAQTASQCFDISVWQFFAALLTGGKTVILPDEVIPQVSDFFELLSSNDVDIAEVVPSYLEVMLDYAEHANHLLSLSYLLVTGETLKPELTARWFEVYPHIKLVNAYGPTEASDDITHYIIESKVSGFSVPVGRAIQNMNVYILNKNLEICPRGVKGEIYVSGIGVGRGYLFNEEKTAAAFLRDPFQKNEEVRMYRTGDIGRYRKDLLIEHLGRNDQQVKIKGYRIELGEIEVALNAVDGVENAVVKALVNDSGEQYLCGYYITKAGTETLVDTIKNTLLKWLPAYMVPAFLMKLKSFPLNANGKINRRMLPVPRFTDYTESDTPAMESDIEKKVKELWKVILNVSEVGLHDNFFNLGGHSLSAARLIVHLHKEFKIRLDLQSIFKYPTVSQIVELITNAEVETYKAIVPVRAQDHYEVSQSQKRLWIINQMEEEKYIYNIPQSYIFYGPLNRELFSQAINQLIEKHEILRTTFVNFEGQPRQKIWSYETFEFAVQFVDLTTDPGKNEKVKEYVQAEEKFPFDLERGPLLRTLLLKVAENEHVFLFTLHHIVADGWSFEILRKDFFRVYNALSSGEPLPAVPLSIQYKDYAWWQKKQINSARFQMHRNYWLNRFKGDIPIVDLPADHARPADKTYNGKSFEVTLGAELAAQIKQYCLENNVSVFMLLLSMVNTLLYKYSGQTDLIIGSPIAGRGHQNLENQIGFYVNLLPMRTRFESTDTFFKLLGLVKETALEAYEHAEYPFDHLVEELGLERDLSRTPLFDVLMVLQNTGLEGEDNILNGIVVENYPLTRNVVKYDLSFNFSESENDIGLSLEYNTDLFCTERMERLIGHFRSLASAVLNNSHMSLAEFDYVSDVEKQEVLYAFNDTKVSYSKEDSVLTLLKAQVQDTPELIALSFKEKNFTYRELDNVTSQLANYLTTMAGVKEKDMVAVRLERTEYSVICMLAILKTGACYIPIETNLPDNRVDFIIDDLQPRAFICSEKTGRNSERFSCNVINVEDIQFSNYSIIAPSVLIKPDNSSYIIYTSGSTGNPKGVVQTHRTLYNLMIWQKDYWNPQPGLHYLQYSSFGFDASLHDVLFALSTGGRIYLIDEEERASFVTMRNLLISQKIDVIWFTFSALVAFFEEIAGDFPLIDLKHIVTTGEAAALNNKLGEYVKTKPGVILHNFYGPSETHVVTCYSVKGGSNDLLPGMPIGKPVYNTRIYILNEKFFVQPKGIPGEIYIDTDGLFKEYLHLEELTRKTCIPSPFEEGRYLYKTGDFGRWLSDGNIEFFGRKDHQVKLRGFRIELKEIELRINKFSGIKKSLVLCREKNGGQKTLVAYIITNQPVNSTAIRTFLSEELPEYMIPSHFITLDAFPLNNNGKIDARALPHPEESDARQEFVHPGNETEEKLLTIWLEILGRNTISTTDNFFKIGGHSLAATRMASRIIKEFNIECNLRKIYKHSTIQELAVEIDSRLWMSKTDPANDLEREKLII